MKKIFAVLFCLTSLNIFAAEGTRLKDLVQVKGVRENPIIGYGLVIGLNGTGDSGGEITNTSLKKCLKN